MAENKCPKCSSLMPEGFRFCTACGSPMNAAPAPVFVPPVAVPPAEPVSAFVPPVQETESAPAAVTENQPAVAEAAADEFIPAEEPVVEETEPVQVFFPQAIPALAFEEPATEIHSETVPEEPVAPEYTPMTIPEMSAPPAYTPPQWQEQYVPVQPVYESPVYEQPVYEEPAASAVMPVDAPVEPEHPVAQEPVKKLKGKEKRAAKKAANAAAAAAVKGTKYEPVKAWGYVANYFLMSIPVLNIILLIVWAFGGCRKIGRRNWARSLFLVFLLNVLFTVLVIGGFIFTLQQLGLDLQALAEGDFTQLEQLFEYLIIEYLEPAAEKYGPEIEEFIIENFG